jgi:hypothetical protein
MPLPTETQDEESNPFAVFETAAQILGFITLNPHPPDSPEWHKWQKLRLKLDAIRKRERKTKPGDAYSRLRPPTKQK